MLYYKAYLSYNSTNWNYINIPDEALLKRCSWFNVLRSRQDRPPWAKQIYPWAHCRNMERLFFLCRTFSDSELAVAWINTTIQDKLTPDQLSLIRHFCYTPQNIKASFDELLEQAADKDIPGFIENVLDRSLLWYDADHTYPNDWVWILKEANETRRQTIDLPSVAEPEPEIEGVDLTSLEEYTHVFYKYQNLVKGLSKGKLYYNIRNLARQAHLALLKAMSLYIEPSYKQTAWNEEDWEGLYNRIADQETGWCKVQLQKVSY